jgi:hypothetical protein
VIIFVPHGNNFLTVIFILQFIIREPYEKYVDSLCYSESELCGGLFFEVPLLASDALLTTLHPLLENVLQTVCRKLQEDSGTGSFLTSEFHGNMIGKAHKLHGSRSGFHRLDECVVGFSKPNIETTLTLH